MVDAQPDPEGTHARPATGAAAPPVRVTSTAIRLRHTGWGRKLGWAAFAMLTLAPLSFVGVTGTQLDMFRVGLGTVLLLSAPVVALVAWLVRAVALRTPGELAVEGDALLVRRGASQQRIPLAKLREGWIDPLRSEVELCVEGGDVIRAHASLDASDRLLAATGLDAAKRTMAMRLGETTFLDLLVVLLGWMPPLFALLYAARQGMPGALLPTLFLALFAASFWVVRRAFGPHDLVVGADGVVVRGTFGTRFVPFERITSVDVATDSVTFQLDDGTTRKARARHLDGAQMAQLRTRFHDARRAWAAGGVAPAALARLDPGARDAREWREELRVLLTRGDDYRSVALTADDLGRVLDSPHADPPRRVAAAVALTAASSGAADTRERIRVAARACAEPRMRVALEKAADGEDEGALEEALELERARGTGG